MKVEKNYILKKSLLILGCIITFIVSWFLFKEYEKNIFESLMVLSVPTGLFFLGQLTYHIFKNELDLFNNNHKKGKKPITITLIIGFIYLFIIGVFMNIGSNTMSIMNLFWISVLIGIMIGLLFTFIFKFHWILFVSLGFFCSGLSISLNTMFLSEQHLCKEYVIDDISYNDYCILFIQTSPTRSESFTISSGLYEQIKDDEKVMLCTKKGLFGYDYVVEFKKVGILGLYKLN